MSSEKVITYSFLNVVKKKGLALKYASNKSKNDKDYGYKKMLIVGVFLYFLG